MKINILLAIFSMAFSTLAHAQDYPNKPVTLVVPAGPGGGTDILARTFATEFAKRVNQPIVVENRAGASGMIGTQAVTRATPDGYTLLFAYSAPIYYAPHIYPHISYDVLKDLDVVSEIALAGYMVVVNNDVPVKNMEEFMAWAQEGKGTINYGSLGTGSAGHLAAAYLNASRDLDMTHVPYKGEAPFAQDLAAGIVPWGMGTFAPMQPHIQSGRVRAIAAMTEERMPALPDVPTLKEQGIMDAELQPMTGFTLAAPAGTPQAILDFLEKHAREITQSEAMRERLQVLGLEPVGNTAAEFRQNYEASFPVLERLADISGARED